jgi:hypothetical protein
MACEKCEGIVERTDVPHVIRKCTVCGREMHVLSPGDHGIGIKAEMGDQLVIPGSWLKFALNPLKSTGHLTRAGLAWFAKLIFVGELTAAKEKFRGELDGLEAAAEASLKNSPLLQGLDPGRPDDSAKVIEVLKANEDSAEWWHFATAIFISLAKDALTAGDAEQAAWAAACAERCRAMVIFKEHVEEVAWMGHSAKRVVDLLGTWDANRDNSDELFWQVIFKQHTYALSQVFAVPLVFIKENAYVGGMNIDRRSAKFVDYLFSAESSREAVLVEIKTPTTKLLAAEYRTGVHPPSSDLAGAVVQALGYRVSLMKDLRQVTDGGAYDMAASAPRCVVLAGNAAGEFQGDNAKRRSFEMFRANSKDVEIVTYDELFRKLEVLVNLFSLSRKREAKPEPK